MSLRFPAAASYLKCKRRRSSVEFDECVSFMRSLLKGLGRGCVGVRVRGVREGLGVKRGLEGS